MIKQLPILISDGEVPVQPNLLVATAYPAKAPYYPVLTGLRAIAAFMVFFTHANPFDFKERMLWQEWLYRYFGGFHVGVAIFFVLSGLLITSRYQHGISLSWQWVQRYVRNRFARIYPMYFLVTVSTFVASQLSLAYDPSRLWQYYNAKDKLLVLGLNLTLLRGFFDRYRFTLAGQGWSLTVEECFYLSTPLLLLGLRGRPGRLVAYPLMLLGIGAGLVALCAPFHEQLFGFFGSMKFMLNWIFFGRGTEFVCGMGLALWLGRRPAMAGGWGGWATALGLLWIAACIAVLAFTERHTSETATELGNYWSFVVMNLVLPVGIVLWFWGLMHEQTWLRRLLETPLADLLGKSSYVFYLIHVGILNFFLDYYVTTNIYFKFIIINMVAIMLYKFVEHPLHNWLTRKKSA